jgi:hypothetical protein
MKKKVKLLIAKARESAVLAVNVYNNPGTVFRSSGFIVLMNIAWLSLLHAIFEKRNIKYFYKDKGDRRKYVMVDGEPKAWELGKCASEYFQGNNNSIYQNILFFIELRNKIEHRFLPELDPTIFGECQSYLINFEEILVSEFGTKYALADTLMFALQYSRIRTDEQLASVRKVQSKHFNEVKGFIDSFRKNLDDSIMADPKYAFKVFLVPKPANREQGSDAVVEFIKYDYNNPEDMKQYDNLVTLIKEKTVYKTVSPSDEIKEATEIVYVDRGKNDSAIGITQDPSKASRILLVQKLSDDIFSTAKGFFDAATILNKKIGEFPLSKKALIYTYSIAPTHEITNEISEVFLYPSYREYVPYYFWLINSTPEAIRDFLHKAFNDIAYPKILSVFRLIIGIQHQQWIDFVIQEVMKPYERYTQKPQWYWSFESMLDRLSGDNGLYAATEILPHHNIVGNKVKDLLDNDQLAITVLSKLCSDLAIGIGDGSTIRNLDLISYYNRLKEVVPNP